MLQSTAYRLPLHIYNAYRLLATSALLAIYLLGLHAQVFSKASLLLLVGVLTIYWAFSVLALYWGQFVRVGRRSSTCIALLVDVFALVLIMHACGGTGSGYGVLLVVVVAATAVLVPTRFVYVVAAVASFALIAEFFYSSFQLPEPQSSMSHTGFLGACLFGMAYLTRHLALRVSRSEQAAASFAALSEQIIELMDIGVLIIGSENKVLHSNAAACALLGVRYPLQHFKQCPHDFQAAYTKRQAYSLPDVYRMQLYPTPPNTLVILYNVREQARLAQQERLAALGQMASNIAHEIRNPLGAIDHAAQLLEGLPELPEKAEEFLALIHKQTKRTNLIIENILQLSRQRPATKEPIRLDTWLPVALSYLKEGSEKLQIKCPAISVECDPSYLQEVLVNLAENALRYSDTVRLEVHSSKTGVNIEVIDRGEGIAPEILEHIFDPFYTTSSTGTGLGLYLAKALCENAGLELSYIDSAHPGAHFRVTIPKDTHE